MPFCPECKCEYVNGVEKCPDCDAELVWELPNPLFAPQYQDLLSDEEAVTVFEAKDSIEAEIVRGILEGAGISCSVTPDLSRRLYGLTTSDGLNPIKIEVMASKAWEAQTVIKEAMEAGSDLPEEM